MDLYPYQREVATAVLDSVLNRKGLTFSVEIARQGGKNELSAHIEVLLLTLFMARGGNSIKAAPTFKPQTIISRQRLIDRLNEFGFTGIWTPEMGYIIRLGEARQVFLSAEERSSVVGNTAHILLEIDESQDISKDKYSKEFKPMGAATNVTTVHYGTSWDNATLLEEVKQSNLELEAADGAKRHFRFDWQEVARYNPNYLKYVEAERQRLGEKHPLFLTQYALVPVQGGGGFLSPQQRAQLQGEHPRRRRPEGGVYVAGVDLAGEMEDGFGTAEGKKRPDATVITIGEMVAGGRQPCGVAQAQVRIVEHYSFCGVSHASLYGRMLDIIKNVWHCRRIVVDSTGMGQPVAGFLKQSLGTIVEPFAFTSKSKSELGFALVAAINAGRVKMYSGDGSDEYRQFWTEMERARVAYRPNQTMNFFVAPSHGHDDFLMSLALLVRASESYQPRSASGR